MKKETKQLILFIILCIAICFAGCKDGNEKQLPVKVQYFNVGDTLFPDMVCPDTLIVVNAEGLNEGMGYIEQGIIDGTDGDIDSILHSNCMVK